MTAAPGKDRFWLDRTTNRQELVEERCAVQPDLISKFFT
jgi:hypothetical protein